MNTRQYLGNNNDPRCHYGAIYDTYTQHKSRDSFRYVLMSVIWYRYLSGNAGSCELISLIAGSVIPNRIS